MIKRLRKLFILISLLTTFVVISLSVTVINVNNYLNVNSEVEIDLDRSIKKAQEGNYGYDWFDRHKPNDEEGNIPSGQQPPEFGNGGENQNGNDKFPQDRGGFGNYFVFKFNSQGQVVESTDFSLVGWIDEDTAKGMAIDALNSDKSCTSVDKYRYKKETVNDYTYIAFVNVTRESEMVNHFLWVSILVSGLSFLVLGGLIVLASFIIFKPSEQAYQKQKKFITNASHELKTPLTIINTDLEIIEMDNGANEWTDSIKDQVNRLTVMTNQLVTLSRLDESNKENYPFEIFSLSEIVNKSIEAFIPLYEKQGLSLKYDISEDVDVKGNESLINQLIYILLDNANKYAKDKGEIFVSLSKNNKNQTLLSVSNDIEEDSQIDVEQLFDRFYRAPTAKTSGSGIGLSIASEIVKLHKGQISAHIENNKIYFEVALK